MQNRGACKKTRRISIHAGCEVFRGLGWVGLEPTTNALKGHCSTIELPTREVREVIATAVSFNMEKYEHAFWCLVRVTGGRIDSAPTSGALLTIG